MRGLGSTAREIFEYPQNVPQKWEVWKFKIEDHK